MYFVVLLLTVVRLGNTSLPTYFGSDVSFDITDARRLTWLEGSASNINDTSVISTSPSVKTVAARSTYIDLQQAVACVTFDANMRVLLMTGP